MITPLRTQALGASKLSYFIFKSSLKQNKFLDVDNVLHDLKEILYKIFNNIDKL